MIYSCYSRDIGLKDSKTVELQKGFMDKSVAGRGSSNSEGGNEEQQAGAIVHGAQPDGPAAVDPEPTERSE